MKVFEWTFILSLATSVFQVLADTEILLNEPQKGVLWAWHSRKVLKEGAGWNSPSTAKPEYSVCDISTSNEPTNWLRTDFIDVKGARLLNIEMVYSLLNCPSSGQQFKYCKTEFSLYVLHEDIKKFPPPDPSKGKFQKVVTITHKVLPKPGKLKEYTYACKVATMARGVYLAFLDQGVCVSIKRVIVSYNYCSEIVSVLVKFQRTVAPVNDSQQVEQAGNCTDVNSINNVKLSGVCLSSGEWNITDRIKCLCKAGYELVNGSDSNPVECNVCLKGFYKSAASNDKCLQCPANSTSNTGRTDCICNDGFYRLTEGAPCKDASCSVPFKLVDCYKDLQKTNIRPLPELLFTDRDKKSKIYSGIPINWGKWDTYIDDLVCRCSQAAKEKQYSHFGIQYYGECWSGPEAGDTFMLDGTSKACVGKKFDACIPESTCAGKAKANAVYSI